MRCGWCWITNMSTGRDGQRLCRLRARSAWPISPATSRASHGMRGEARPHEAKRPDQRRINHQSHRVEDRNRRQRPPSWSQRSAALRNLGFFEASICKKGPRSGAFLQTTVPRRKWPAFKPPHWPGIRPPLTKSRLDRRRRLLAEMNCSQEREPQRARQIPTQEGRQTGIRFCSDLVKFCRTAPSRTFSTQSTLSGLPGRTRDAGSAAGRQA